MKTLVLERKDTIDPDVLLGEMVQVSCGTEETRCFPGRTVAQLRAEFADRLQIPEEGAVAILDGSPVRKDQETMTIVGPSTEQVEFVGRPGPKG